MPNSRQRAERSGIMPTTVLLTLRWDALDVTLLPGQHRDLVRTPAVKRPEALSRYSPIRWHACSTPACW